MSPADDEPNTRYNSFHDDGRGGLEMKAANTASSQQGTRRETTYVRQSWIKSLQALMRYELQVHNPTYAKTRSHTPFATRSANGSPARIGLIRMRGAAPQFCSRVRRARRNDDGDLENHQA